VASSHVLISHCRYRIVSYFQQNHRRCGLIINRLLSLMVYLPNGITGKVWGTRLKRRPHWRL